MNENPTLKEAEEIRRNTVYTLAKNAYKNRKKGVKIPEILGNIAEKYGYKSPKSVYNILLEKKKNDPEFNQWWLENRAKKSR